MKRLSRSLVLGCMAVSAVALLGCAQMGAIQKQGVVAHITDIDVGGMQTRPATVEVNGVAAVMYSKNQRVLLQVGDKSQYLDETARVKQGPRNFQLHGANQTLRALWWSHRDGKNGYFTTSPDAGKTFSPVSAVNDDHGILATMSLLDAGDGRLGISYLDERYQGYQIYFNRSNDGGRTWNTPDQRLDTPIEGRSSTVTDPQTVDASGVWVAIWSESEQRDGRTAYRIVVRTSADAGVNWDAPGVIFRTDYQPSQLKAKAFGKTIVIVAEETSKGVISLVSNDQANTWTKLATIEVQEGTADSGFEIAIAPGRAHVVWMQDPKVGKTRIMTASMDTSQAQWVGVAKQLDVKAVENTKSAVPVVDVLPNGTAVAAWVDYRDIRPNIYLSSSHDGGATWQSPRALLKQGEQFAFWPQFVRWGDQLALGYETYPSDLQTRGNYTLQLLEVGDKTQGILGLQPSSTVSEAQRKEKLERRIQELWTARVSDDYERAYDIFDFAYKAVTPKKFYVANIGVIKYLEYSQGEISITGNEANVAMKVKYEVKPIVIPQTGKPIAVPPTDTDVPTKWVWIGSDWYLVYTPSFDPPMLKY
jgi:hypothetical protein